MLPDQYVWFAWATAFLVPWIMLYLAFPAYRAMMRWASVYTMPFGLTEPLFVPIYWNPPSLFGLAQRSGFDIESLIFTFAVGGVASVLYAALTRGSPRAFLAEPRREKAHKYHRLALAAPFIAFPILYLFPWNPIYAASVALLIAAGAAMLCRPDLKTEAWTGGLLFLAFYVLFLFGLEWTAPNYIERVWNLPALSGVLLLGMPVEELLWAFAFGMYWSGVYEHFNWRRVAQHDG